MTSLLGAQRRVEEFAAAVDATIGPQPVGVQTGADQTGAAQTGAVPAGRRNLELAELITLVTALRHTPRSTPQSTPRPAYVEALRERLLDEARSAPAGRLSSHVAPIERPARPSSSRHERRIAMAAAALVLVGGSTGMAAAAQNALPGDALYPIKRGLEKAEAGLSVSAAGKGRDLLAQATNRLDEARGLLFDEGGDKTQVVPTLHAFEAPAVEGTKELLNAYQEDQDVTAVNDVRTFTASSLTTLQELVTQAPPELRGDLSAAAATVTEIDSRAKELCPDCGDGLDTLAIPPVLAPDPGGAGGGQQDGAQGDAGGIPGDLGSPLPSGAPDDPMTDVPGSQLPAIPGSPEPMEGEVSPDATPGGPSVEPSPSESPSAPDSTEPSEGSESPVPTPTEEATQSPSGEATTPPVTDPSPSADSTDGSSGDPEIDPETDPESVGPSDDGSPAGTLSDETSPNLQAQAQTDAQVDADPNPPGDPSPGATAAGAAAQG